MIRLEQYRDTWLSEKMDEVIGFYPREFYCFDNFSSFKVEYDGYLYASNEEAYQALSFEGSANEIVEQIKHSHSAHEAQKIAYANRERRRKDWDDIKLSVMEELLRAKLEQNPYVKKKLLETKDYLIVEDSPKDPFWGWGPDRNGENNLGKLWMKLRSEIKEREGCLSAGNDIVLMPQNINEAFDIIYRNVNEGKIEESRIDDSVYKILSVKFDYGFFKKDYEEFLKYNENSKTK